MFDFLYGILVAYLIWTAGCILWDSRCHRKRMEEFDRWREDDERIWNKPLEEQIKEHRDRYKG